MVAPVNRSDVEHAFSRIDDVQRTTEINLNVAIARGLSKEFGRSPSMWRSSVRHRCVAIVQPVSGGNPEDVQFTTRVQDHRRHYHISSIRRYQDIN